MTGQKTIPSLDGIKIEGLTPSLLLLSNDK